MSLTLPLWLVAYLCAGVALTHTAISLSDGIPVKARHSALDRWVGCIMTVLTFILLWPAIVAVVALKARRS